MDNDATASRLGNGWAVSDNETDLDELSTKDEANCAFRESLEELFLNPFLHETKKICNGAEDSEQLLKRFLKDGDDCRWRKEKMKETPRVTFYTLAKNSLVTSDCTTASDRNYLFDRLIAYMAMEFNFRAVTANYIFPLTYGLFFIHYY
jgi:hypothetical protein